MGKLHELGLKHGTDKATYHGYCDFYEQHLPTPESGRVKRLLEIGVKDGASLRMWRDYYPDAEIMGVDIAPMIVVEGCFVRCMDATDVWALASLGRFDLIVDDGSHMTKDQQITFLALYPMLTAGGCYILEDVHTSRWPTYTNTWRTTIDLMTQHFPDRLLFQRDPAVDDSMTMLIKKP